MQAEQSLKAGLGDTCEPFANLGASLRLPSTAVLSLQAPDQCVSCCTTESNDPLMLG